MLGIYLGKGAFFVEYARARYNKEQAGAELCQAQSSAKLIASYLLSSS